MTDPFPTHDVFVSNLCYDTTREELHALGADFGGVVHTHLPTDPENHLPKGYGFIRYRTREEAELCIKGLAGKEFKGRRLRTNWGHKRSEPG